MFAMAILIALLPFAAEAQHGGGGSHGGSSSGSTSSGSRGGSSSSGTARSTNSGGSRSNSNNTTRATRNNQAGGKSTFQKQRSSGNDNNQNHSTNIHNTRPVNAWGTTTQREAIGARVPAQHEHIAVGEYHHRGFWPGGLFWGIFYAPGWYYSVGFAPAFWYYGPMGYGYQYNIGEPSDLSGIKFDLDQIPKDERKVVENGNILVDGDEATNGRVKNFSGMGNKKILLLGPGDHDITVKIKGGQEISMSAVVQPGHVTHVALSFDRERTESKQPPDSSLSTIGTNPLAPAPTDSPKN